MPRGEYCKYTIYTLSVQTLMQNPRPRERKMKILLRYKAECWLEARRKTTEARAGTGTTQSGRAVGPLLLPLGSLYTSLAKGDSHYSKRGPLRGNPHVYGIIGLCGCSLSVGASMSYSLLAHLCCCFIIPLSLLAKFSFFLGDNNLTETCVQRVGVFGGKGVDWFIHLFNTFRDERMGPRQVIRPARQCAFG